MPINLSKGALIYEVIAMILSYQRVLSKPVSGKTFVILPWIYGARTVGHGQVVCKWDKGFLH